MIAMQMRDEHMRDATVLDLVAHQLQLGSFSAVDQEFLPIHVDQLAGR